MGIPVAYAVYAIFTKYQFMNNVVYRGFEFFTIYKKGCGEKEMTRWISLNVYPWITKYESVFFLGRNKNITSIHGFKERCVV